MKQERPSCAYCGATTSDLCAACGLPFGRDHLAAPCPRCAHQALARARWAADLVPSETKLAGALLLLLAGSVVIALAHLLGSPPPD